MEEWNSGRLVNWEIGEAGSESDFFYHFVHLRVHMVTLVLEKIPRLPRSSAAHVRPRLEALGLKLRSPVGSMLEKRGVLRACSRVIQITGPKRICSYAGKI
jgi:hypothetical protein